MARTTESAPRVKMVLGGVCMYGHPLTEDKIYIYPEGSTYAGKVVCKVCRMNAQRRRKGIPESDSIGTWNKNKTHCANGHEYTEENTRIKSDGSRGCRTCHARGMRKRSYGIEWEDFEKLWESQNQSCAICKKQFNSTSEACVDHDHVTGDVRGLLCNQCNNGLGRFFDNIDYLKRAVEYLTVGE